MFLKLKLFSSLTLILLLLTTTTLMTSCNKDDDKEEETCENFPAIDGTVKVNNDNLTLSVAQLLVNSFDQSVIYGFLISGFTSDCNKLLSVEMTVQIPKGTTLNGTYQVKDFFGADDGDVTGSIISQQIEPVSQSSKEFVSGTVKFTSLGNNKYTIDLNAKTVTNETVTLNLTHTF